MSLGTITGLTTCCGCALGGGGGGGAAATEYCATCAGELLGNETFQIAPTTTATITATWMPMETGRVTNFWIPIFVLRDSMTVDSNMLSSFFRLLPFSV